MGEDGTANSRSNNNSTNVSYSKMNMHYSGRTYLSALHMHIRVRVRVIWGGTRFELMSTSTRRSQRQSTYLHLLLFRGSPSWLSGRETDKRQPAARPTPPSDRHAPRMQPFDAVTSPVVKDLVSGSGPHRKEHFYLLGFSRRQSTGSRHSGSTGLPRTTDGSFESSDPCLHRVSHAGPRSGDRNPGSEDLSVLIKNLSRSKTTTETPLFRRPISDAPPSNKQPSTRFPTPLSG